MGNAIKTAWCGMTGDWPETYCMYEDFDDDMFRTPKAGHRKTPSSEGFWVNAFLEDRSAPSSSISYGAPIPEGMFDSPRTPSPARNYLPPNLVKQGCDDFRQCPRGRGAGLAANDRLCCKAVTAAGKRCKKSYCADGGNLYCALHADMVRRGNNVRTIMDDTSAGRATVMYTNNWIRLNDLDSGDLNLPE